jgi:hypothetical protein
MKRIIESWRGYLLKESILAAFGEQLSYDENGNLILYHISSTEDISTLDPAIAAQNIKGYTKREYREWDRPRVFFFTRLGQEDPGVGRIQGSTYKAVVDPEKVYPLMKDPLKLSYPDKEGEYKQLRLERDGTPAHYPVNRYDMVATLAEAKYGFEGLIYQHGKDPENLIVALWNPTNVEKFEQDFY